MWFSIFWLCTISWLTVCVQKKVTVRFHHLETSPVVERDLKLFISRSWLFIFFFRFHSKFILQFTIKSASISHCVCVCVQTQQESLIKCIEIRRCTLNCSLSKTRYIWVYTLIICILNIQSIYPVTHLSIRICLLLYKPTSTPSIH